MHTEMARARRIVRECEEVLAQRKPRARSRGSAETPRTTPAADATPPAWPEIVAGLDTAAREKLRATAIHEAGHFVVAALTGSGLSYLALDPIWAGARVVSFDGAAAFPPHQQGWAEDVVSAAGFAAEMLAGSDFHDAEKRSCRDFTALRGEQVLQGQAIDAARAVRGARALLRQHWSAVEALAREVMARGRVEGHEAGELMREWGVVA